MATLKVDLFDVYGDRLGGRASVRLKNLRVGGGHSRRDLPASRRIKVEGLEDFPHGHYRVTVDTAAHHPVTRFVMIPASNEEHLRMHLPVDAAKVTGLDAPDYDDLTEETVRLLEDSDAALGFEGRSGRDLYEALDDVRRAGFLNILAKCRAVPLPGGGLPSRLLALRELRGDRFFVTVPHALREDVKNAVATGLFHPEPDLLHHPPDGYDRAGSFKTDDRYGNLQITFFVRDGDWVADVDIDDAAGLEHVFQVVRNALTGRPTHPYDIHEILVFHQRLDPMYRLEV